MTSNQENFKNEFIHFALDAKVLAFGEFKTKAGRLSPYFFNAGGFNDGALLKALGEFYAKALIDSGIQFDMLFGPAYKGITLAATTAVALAGMGRPVPFCFNRKEAKDHGEGGTLVGAPLKGRVVIIDDVISAGTSEGTWRKTNMPFPFHPSRLTIFPCSSAVMACPNVWFSIIIWC